MSGELVISAQRREVGLTISTDALLHEKNAAVATANTALDECLHGTVTGAGAVDNMAQAVADLSDIKAAIEEKGMDVPEATAEYADVIRDEMIASDKPILNWENWERFDCLFSNNDKLDLLPYLKYSDTSNAVSIWRLFFYAAEVSEIPYMDTSKCEDFGNAFQGCTIVEVPPLDTSNGKSFTQTFSHCRALKKIGLLNVSKAESLFNTFIYCNSLTDIRFEGEIPISIAFPNSPLSNESIKSVVTHLKDYSGTEYEDTYTVTFKTAYWDKFNATECTEGYATWADYAAAKGWNIAKAD